MAPSAHGVAETGTPRGGRPAGCGGLRSPSNAEYHAATAAARPGRRVLWVAAVGDERPGWCQRPLESGPWINVSVEQTGYRPLDVRALVSRIASPFAVDPE